MAQSDWLQVFVKTVNHRVYWTTHIHVEHQCDIKRRTVRDTPQNLTPEQGALAEDARGCNVSWFLVFKSTWHYVVFSMFYVRD